MRFPAQLKRISGIAIPVSALRSASSEGVGDFLDLIPFADFAAACGMKMIQLLPVNDSGFESSPYFSLTAFALHPLYIRLDALGETAPFKDDIKKLKKDWDGCEKVGYKTVLETKLTILRKAFDRHADTIMKDKAIDAWEKENPWIREYALFLHLKGKNNQGGWMEWSDKRRPEENDIAAWSSDSATRKELKFHAWVQYRLEEQFVKASKYVEKKGIAIMGDLPILMNVDSADVWASGRFFRLDMRAGAPPDMFSTLGQNWGFPIYDWDELAKDGYSFWINRLRQADKFYHAYRIDHVLGFFRIWSLSERNESGYLGRFVPGETISRTELLALGFDNARIRWLSEPHIPVKWIYDSLYGSQSLEADVKAVMDVAFDRIGSEDLFLFKRSILGERDLNELPVPHSVREQLKAWYRNRVFMQINEDEFVPTWSFWDTQAYPTLSSMERNALEVLFARKREISETDWKLTGKQLLTILKKATDMLPCAEDLGAVPDCVPDTLVSLGILGLRIVRWTKDWKAPGEPWVRLSDYTEPSVCTPSCHDTSCLREWWETEAGKYDFWRFLLGEGECPEKYTPETAEFALSALAASRSRIYMLQLQELLALEEKYAPAASRDERVNVPGTMDDSNWTYRMPITSETLLADGKLTRKAQKIAAIHDCDDDKNGGAK